MSVVFECVVLAAPKSAVVTQLHAVNGLAEEHAIEVEVINDSFVVIYWDFFHRREFGDYGEQLSAILSRHFGRAVLVRYDSGTCFRASVLFIDGLQEKSFHLADEKWVLLDEEGRPDPSQGVFLTHEMVKGKEYETIENAVQLGLKELGFGDWKSLLTMMDHL